MHKTESFQENEMHKLLCDFVIKTDHIISAWQPDLVIVNNNKKQRTCRIEDFAVPADHSVKLKGGEKRAKYPDLGTEYKNDDDTNLNRCARYSHQKEWFMDWRTRK